MPATDSFSAYTKGTQGPATDGVEITPDNENDLDYVTRAVYIGSAGNLRVTLQGGSDVTLRNVGAGTVLPVRVVRVWQSGTTAADLVALW